jgi:hypothetical protein
MTEFLKSKFDKLIAIGAAVGMVVCLTGCQLKPRQAQAVAANPTPVAGEVETNKSTTVATKQPPEIANLKPPMVIFIAIDKTGSAKSSKIPNLTIDPVISLVQTVAKNSGELRVGNVCTDSDLALASFYASELPSPLDIQLPQKPTIQTAGNPLNLPKLNVEYRKQLAIYQQREAAYKQEVAARDRSNQQKMGIFVSQVKKLLEQPANCGATDIIGMMKRADLYMNEPDANWKQKPRKVAILITDGLETVKANPKPIEWTSKAEVVLVSSGGEAGILKPLLTNTPFESIDAAVRYVVTDR